MFKSFVLSEVENKSRKEGRKKNKDRQKEKSTGGKNNGVEVSKFISVLGRGQTVRKGEIRAGGRDTGACARSEANLVHCFDCKVSLPLSIAASGEFQRILNLGSFKGRTSGSGGACVT